MAGSAVALGIAVDVGGSTCPNIPGKQGHPVLSVVFKPKSNLAVVLEHMYKHVFSGSSCCGLSA